MTETLRHMEAFELYYGLGDRRSLPLVAGECRVSEKTIAVWSKQFRWQARVAERDLANAERLRAQTDNTVVAERAHLLDVVLQGIRDFEARLADGQVRVASVGDFERLVKLYRLLVGEATENIKHCHDWEEVTGLGALTEYELGLRLAECAAALGASDPQRSSGADPCQLQALP